MAATNSADILKSLKPGTIILVIVLIAIFAIGASSFFIVDQTEEAVVLTFGKYTETKGAGLHFKLPFGIQQNYNVRTKVVQTEQFGFRSVQSSGQTQYSDGVFSESTMLTGDLNIVDVEWIIQYRIANPRAWLFHMDNRHKTIRDISQSVINLLVGDMTILDVIGPQRTVIEETGTQLMNDSLKGYGLGIEIIAVRLQNIVPPSGVQSAFEDVNMAQQDMNRLINEGKEAYNKEIPRARGEADRIIQIARGYASERVNKANGDVARFSSVYEEYRKAPAITRERLYYEAMESIFQNETGIELIDRQLENFLPMMNLGSGTGGQR